MNAELLKKQHDAIFSLDFSPPESRKAAFSVACNVSGDGMAASVKVETAGGDCPVSEFDILCALFKRDVRVGVNYFEIEDIVRSGKFNREIIVAAGFPPENGRGAELIPLVDFKEFPPAAAAGGVSAQRARVGAPVDIDQAIMEKRPATPGVAGLTVLGKKLLPVPGKDAAFELGGNVAVSANGLRLVAMIPGLAGISDGKPSVREDNSGEWKFRIQLRKEAMEAVLVIVPGAGEQPEINEESVRKLLSAANVVFGMDSDLAKSIPPKISVTTMLKAASGKAPVPGKSAVIVEHFRKDAGKDQNLFYVKKGQLLVEKTSVRPGEEGTNVLGEPVPAREGKDVEIQPGLNTVLSADKLKLSAAMDGYVSRLLESYCVVECVEYDSSSSPIPQIINYDGMVKISGNVTKGHMITAGHHVVVQGNITSSEVVAGGFLQVHGDIEDCADTKIQATSDMFLSSCRRARIRAGGNIYFSGSAHNCEIVSNGGIFNAEKGGFSLVGGRVIAARSVEADEIGSPENVQTVIEAGLPLPVRVRYEQAVRELNEITRKKAAVEIELKRLVPLSKTNKITRPELETMRKLIHVYKMIVEKIARISASVSSMLVSINSAHGGASVTARSFVYPGTILKVGVFAQQVNESEGAVLYKTNKDNTALMTRKLASKPKVEMTIMFTDIVGYSTYTSIHGDMAASAMLDKHNELLFPLVPENSGRIIKTIGDSIMAVFDKPENAVRSGIDMQRALEEHNEDEPDEHKIKIRIGINTGDGIVEGGDVFGDVVNMAARVESLTDGDEVKISISTYKAVYDKVDVEFRSLGLKKLKGKEERVEVFDVMWQE